MCSIATIPMNVETVSKVNRHLCDCGLTHRRAGSRGILRLRTKQILIIARAPPAYLDFIVLLESICSRIFGRFVYTDRSQSKRIPDFIVN